jgi:DNA replication and checkpoint protein
MMAKTSNDHGMNETQQENEPKDRLRAELKIWERAFEKQHGHKPTPADVKANSEISAKYKLYHKSFRTKTSSRDEKPKEKPVYTSSAHALKRITPQKRLRDDILTPSKSIQVSDEIESVGPTPQLNGRVMGLFDGLKDQTPIGKRRKLTWGERLAEARKDSPKKSTPRRRSLSGSFNPE